MAGLWISVQRALPANNHVFSNFMISRQGSTQRFVLTRQGPDQRQGCYQREGLHAISCPHLSPLFAADMDKPQVCAAMALTL